MTDSRTRLDKAVGHLHLEWSDQEVEVALVRLHQRRRRRQLVTRSVAVAAVALLALGVGLWVARAPSGGQEPPAPQIAVVPPPQQPPPAKEPASQPMPPAGHWVALADGSSWRLLSETSKLVLDHVSAERVQLSLRRGAARFRLAHRTPRRFEIVVGKVKLSAAKSSFAVTRDAKSGRVEVHVFEGQVTAGWSGGDATLLAGDVRSFPPIAEEPTRPAARKRRHATRWRKLARAGRYAEAYRHLRAEKKRDRARAVRDEPKDLFLAADAARLAGDPRGALPYLAAIVKRHRRDVRAGLAAFTMGRLLLDLGRPRPAARRFAEAHNLLEGRSLAEDALAREAEAWARAGNKARARQRAQRYVQEYPQGRRVAAMRNVISSR